MNNVEYLYYTYLNKYKEKIQTNNTLVALKIIHLIYQVLFFISIILLLYLKYDSKMLYIILIIWLIVIFHWILLKGECIIDLIEKKILNKTYKIGDIIVFLIDFNYNIFTKKINKYNTIFSNYYYIKILKLILIIIALFKININGIYKLIIFFISLICLLQLIFNQYKQEKYINSLNKNHSIFKL